jgi:glycosyltransferase involved in cell wall biosynthesis
VGTIFPFWVPGPNDSGYVELPYTLVQDFNLFVVLQEPNIDIWKRKLDWVAQRGGMALLNTHPDYMCFDGGKPDRDEYPAGYYEEFLRYAQEKYAGEFWSANPRDVARYYCSTLPPSARNSRKRICMVAYTRYDTDNRVRRYAEALAKRGDHVEVIALGSDASEAGVDQIKGVSVHRILSRSRKEKRKWAYALPLLRFCLASARLLKRRHRQVQYDLIHVHNVPDFLVFAAWYPKLTGAKLILDIHDIVPELFASKFAAHPSALYVRALRTVEKLSTAFADHVIVSNDIWRKTLVSRSVTDARCSVFLNHVDREVFFRRERTRNDGKFVMLFPGTFQWHQGLDIAIRALADILKQVPTAELHLYGGGGGADAKARLSELADHLNLDGHVKFFGGVPLDQMPDIMANADVGVVPKRANSFGNEAYSTKIMEFMSQGVPVVASRTKIDTLYFDETVVRFFESGSIEGFAEAVVGIAEDGQLRDSLSCRGFEYAERHSWDSRKRDYYGLVDSLTVERFE